MDEFDVYLARAYSGGQLPSPTDDSEVAAAFSKASDEPRNTLLVQTGHSRGRRHSSVGLRSPANPNASPEFIFATGDERNPDHKPDIRRKLSATTVTVAVEPPSPTELLFGHPLGKGGHRKPSTSNENGQPNGCNEDSSPNRGGGDQKHFGRSRTAPVQRRIAPSEEQSRHRRGKQAENRSDGGRGSAGGDGSGGTNRTASESPSSSRRCEKKSDLSGGAIATVLAATRPDRLLLTTSNFDSVTGNGGDIQKGDVSPGTIRRRSTTCTPETQRLAVAGQPSPATLRRNSCNGPLGSISSASQPSSNVRPQPSPLGNQLRVSGSTNCALTLSVPAAHGASGSSLSASPSCLSGRSTSRRNSAITYLTESTTMLAAPGRFNPRARPDERRSFSADGAIVDPAQLEALLQLAARSGAVTESDRGVRSPENSRSPEGAAVWRSGSTVGVCSMQSLADRHVCRVAVIGVHEVGKSTLTRQLMTSEYLANSENYHEDDCQEKTTCILLDNEETIVQFIDDQSAEEAFRDSDNSIDAFLVVYSVTDRNSFAFAQTCLQDVAKRQQQRHSGVDPVFVLVANKNDLVRNRAVSTADGKRLAAKRHCKFLEVSALLDHKVDEVLVAIVRESRSKTRRKCLLGGAGGSDQGRTDDSLSNDMTGKGCLQRAAFALFRKLFK